MLPAFNNLKEFSNQFSDDKVCREYLENMIWKGKPSCPHCGGNKPYKLKDGKTYRCSDKECKKDFTITVGTVFEGSNVPLSKWFLAIYIATNHKKGISSIQLGKDVGVTQRTAWFMLHRIREMVRPKQEVILTEEVMVDETYCGGKQANKSNRKRALINSGELKEEKIPVFGLVQKDGNTVLRVVPDAKGETLRPIILQVVNEDTVIVSDGAVVHRGLDESYKGHIIVNHANGEYVNGPYTTNHIESVFALLKRTVYGTYHNVSPKHLQAYCAEVGHRYNTRKIKDNYRFNATIEHSAGRLKYKDLIAKI